MNFLSKYASFILIFLAFSSNLQEAQSQILNIEKARLDNDTLNKFLGNVNLGMTLKQRNTQVFSFNSGLNLTQATKLHNYILIGTSQLIKIEDSDVISDASLHARANLMKRKSVSYELFVQGQYDDARGLNYRFLTGGGTRFRLRYSDKITLALSTGIMYEEEEWQVDDNFALTQYAKSTNYLSAQNQFTDNFEINFIVYYQARFNHFFEPRVFSDINLNFSISKLLSFNSKFSTIYDAAPVVPIREWFYTFSNGLTIRF